MLIINPKDNFIYEKVSKLHVENIKEGFMSELGVNFLKCFYQTIAQLDNGFLAVYVDDNNQVLGFIAGVVSLSKLKKAFQKRCFWQILNSFAKLIFMPRYVRKFYENYKYSSRIALKQFPESELISIVVKNEFRRKGVSKLLYLSLIDFFKKKNVESFKIIVGSKLIEAQKFYEKMGATKIAEIEFHKGIKSILYIHII